MIWLESPLLLFNERYIRGEIRLFPSIVTGCFLSFPAVLSVDRYSGSACYKLPVFVDFAPGNA